MVGPATILGIFNWCLVFIAIFIYAFIFYLMYRCSRETRDISLLLTLNTCAAALLTCLTVCVMISSNLVGPFLIQNMSFCFTWGLFYDVFECSIYHSYCLQAFYRLCRVVFYKQKYLVSTSIYIILIICQWSWILVLLIPPVFINWYARLPTENYCLIPYTYVGAEIYHILILYLIPLSCIGVTYLWITLYMRETTRASTVVLAAVQRQRNQRDLTVIKRIIMLVSILVVLRFPTIIFVVYGVISGSLFSLTYPIVGVITSGCLIFIGLITIYVTTQLRKQFVDLFIQRNNRVENGPLRSNLPIHTIAALAVRPTKPSSNASSRGLRR